MSLVRNANDSYPSFSRFVNPGNPKTNQRNARRCLESSFRTRRQLLTELRLLQPRRYATMAVDALGLLNRSIQERSTCLRDFNKNKCGFWGVCHLCCVLFFCVFLLCYFFSWKIGGELSFVFLFFLGEDVEKDMVGGEWECKCKRVSRCNCRGVLWVIGSKLDTALKSGVFSYSCHKMASECLNCLTLFLRQFRLSTRIYIYVDICFMIYFLIIYICLYIGTSLNVYCMVCNLFKPAVLNKKDLCVSLPHSHVHRAVPPPNLTSFRRSVRWCVRMHGLQNEFGFTWFYCLYIYRYWRLQHIPTLVRVYHS